MPDLHPGQFKLYHGTSEGRIDTILPANAEGHLHGGTNHSQSSPDHAYATTDLKQAQHWANWSQGGGVSRHVYEVSAPVDDLERDTNFGSPNAYRSRTGFNVEREVPFDA